MGAHADAHAMQGRTNERAAGSRLDVREDAAPGLVGERPWLGVYFRCSGQYRRVFRNADGSGYIARCPSCGKSVRFVVGQGGSNQRFFEVAC